MGKSEKQRSQYYQAIAREFLTHRGTPFFLSSKDLILIAQWEKMRIPLKVVLEGIERSFENYRMKSGKKGKVTALAFCEPQVLRNFEQYRERQVGLKKKVVTQEERRKKIRDEVQRFLKDLHPQVNFLREVYSHAEKMLSRKNIEESELERMDEEVERILLSSCLEEEKELVRKEVLNEFRPAEGEFSRIFEAKLLKLLRNKYKIPYLSSFYY
jgi:hypothetical protein